MQGGLELIGHFPDPHPDELFYSVCARFSDHMQYPTVGAVARELFGTEFINGVIDFPCRLNALVSVLPLGHSYTVDILIDDHTLLPLYGPFLPPERLRYLRNHMYGDRSTAHAHAGITYFQAPLLQWLRFCPLCLDNDRQQFGECYWHRVHQVPGVEVCPTHEVLLQNSNTHPRSQRTKNEFISAESAIHEIRPQPPSKPSNHGEILLKIARDSMWLLNQRGLTSDFESLSKRYLAIFFEHGLATYGGLVYQHKLIQLFQEYYPSDLLNLLHCKLSTKRITWLNYLIHPKKRVQSPLHHLLLIHFLEHTAETFFNYSIPFTDKPFGEGPWPCLNPTCAHYRESQIQHYHIIHRKSPIGVFSCACGFVYYRTGPDMTIEDRYKISRVKTFGPTWETALRNLWEDPSFTIKQIADRLGCYTLTVKRHATKLGLPSHKYRGKLLDESQQLHSSLVEGPIPDKLDMYRRVWLASLQEDPEATIQQRRNKLENVYKWLSEHDKEWLKKHKPVREQRLTKQVSSRNWKDRDTKLAEEVKASILRIKNAIGRPIRLTIREIGRDCGQRETLYRHLDKLPLTAKILSEATETFEAYALRRIQWVTECYLQERVQPKRWQLIYRAGVPRKANIPSVKEAIDAALEYLSSASQNPLNFD